MVQFGNFNMNMFNSNMLGMGSMFGANSFGLGGSSFLGSIWGGNLSSPFMNCNGTVNYDAMAGFGVGNFLANFFLTTLNGYISNKKENSSDSIKNDINEMNSSIKDLNNKLENYQKDESTINNKISENDSNIQSKNKTITENTTNITALKGKLDTLPKDENNIEIEMQIKNLKDEIKKLEEANKKLTSEIETLQKDNETQKEKLDKVQADIKNVKEEINKFENYKKNAQKMLKNEILEKADGYKIQRTNQNDYDKLFTKDDKNKAWSLPADYKSTSDDVRFAILGYKKATTEEEKKKYQEQFKLLWENLPIEDRTDSLRAAANIILG